MAQDIPPSSDIEISYENDLGGTITVTIDGNDFVISASRTRPRPLVDQAADYIGTAASAVYHHPVDVTIPFFLVPVLAGTFNSVAPQAQQNAQAIMRLAVGGLGAIRRPADLRLALQMLLVYQQTDLRGRMALATSVRVGTGMFITPWIFSFGGRWKIKSRAGRIAKSGGMFALATVGSVYRVCLKIYQRDPRNTITGPYSILLAMITGEDRIIDLPQELGLDAYFKIRTYLREHPEAIQLDDFELQLAQTAINWFFDFIEDPKGFLNSNNHE